MGRMAQGLTMKQFVELQNDIKNNEELRALAMEMAQFIFSKSQQNLVDPMPWGNDKYKSDRTPSKISDTSGILLSGVPPYWKDSKTIEFRYDAPHSKYVEDGTPPHPMGKDVVSKQLVGWVMRKYRGKDDKAIRNKKQALRIAWAIATNIRKDGMDPHPFVRPAIEAGINEYKMFQVRTL